MLNPYEIGPVEPNPRDYSGTCGACGTDHYLGGKDEGWDIEPCSCGAATCCPSCDTCDTCGEFVCADCSVTIGKTSRDERIRCATCYEQWLDEQPPASSNPAAVALQEMLAAFSKEVKAA